MDFVEAVRLGCEQTTETRGLFKFDEKLGITGACVLGAAFLGAGFVEILGMFSIAKLGTTAIAIKLREMFPVLNAAGSACPAESCKYLMPMTPTVLAVHLNDFHRWPRMRTAKHIQNLGS